MKNNDMIIYNMNNIEIYDLSSEQAIFLKDTIIKNVNIKQLEEKIHEIILKLTGVGAPSFGADAVYIALDNQKRLELTYKLLYNLDIFKSFCKNFKSNKHNCNFESDYIYSFLIYTKDLVNIIYDYGEYRKLDLEEQKKQVLIAQEKLKLLKEQKLQIKLNTKKEEVDNNENT